MLWEYEVYMSSECCCYLRVPVRAESEPEAKRLALLTWEQSQPKLDDVKIDLVLFKGHGHAKQDN
jgi:hypothetical protein